ncbi:MAG TPA: HEAT repeat domain-containing protein [Phycisphaerae bacterium]|nr:HEAT repeat domain-containing protein [Phycisphaerae bacterium]
MQPRRAGGKIPPPTLKPVPSPDAAARFRASMIMDYEKWHDGIGYDTDALREIPPAELAGIAASLIRHSPRDWRDIEALGRINLPEARAAVLAALEDSDPAVRRTAQELIPAAIDDKTRERKLIDSIRSAAPFEGLTHVLADAQEFHPPPVIDALFKAALTHPGESAVHYAALLFFLHGKSKEAFDWDHRPFFLTFNETDPKLRRAAFRQLCATCGVDPEKYMGGPL